MFGRVLTLAILLLYSIALSGLGSGSSHDFEDLNGCTKSIIIFFFFEDARALYTD